MNDLTNKEKSPAATAATAATAVKVMGIVVFFATLGLGHAGWGLTVGCALMIGAAEWCFGFRGEKWFNPYVFMLLAPALLIKYASIADFGIRLVSFLLFALILGAAYRKSGRENQTPPGLKKDFPQRFTSGPLRVWLTAFLIFAAASAGLHFQGIHLSGDEPHYLMITQSMVEDGDFDLKNNVEGKTYYNYLPIELRFHGGEYNGKYLSFHLPGVSFLLVPFYWMYKTMGGADTIHPALYFRLVASVLNAFFGLVLFYILKTTFRDRKITGLWLFLLVTYPLVFHGIHLYPELPAATLMMTAYLLYLRLRETGETPEGGTVSQTNRIYLFPLLMGLVLAFVPWFHVKYIPPLGILTLAILYDFMKPLKPLRMDGAKIKQLVMFFAFPALIGLLLVIYCKTLYGSYSPTNIFPKESYWTVPFMLRLKVFFSYFLDQRDGLLFYAPLLFGAFFGLRKKFPGRGLLVCVLLSYVFFHAFTSVRGAYAPAGRPLIFGVWILMIFLFNYFLSLMPGAGSGALGHDDRTDGTNGTNGTNGNKGTNGSNGFWFYLGGGLSVFVAVWLFYYPLFVYQPVFSHTVERASGFNLFLGGTTIELWKLFPSFITHPQTIHVASLVWIGILLGAIVFFHLKPLPVFKLKKGKTITGAVLFVLLTGLYCVYPHVHLLNQNTYTGKEIRFYNNSKNFHYLAERNGFRIKGGNRYDIYIDRKMTAKDNITFRFTYTDKTRVTIHNGKTKLFESSPKEKNTFSFKLSRLKTLLMDDKEVSHLSFDTETAAEQAFLWLEIDAE